MITACFVTVARSSEAVRTTDALIGLVRKRAIGPFYERRVSVGWLRNRIREAIARDRSPITEGYA